MTKAVDTEQHMSDHVENASVPHYESDLEMSPRRYMATRLSTLKPPMTIPPNPFKVLGLLRRRDWLFFAVRINR
jgi:SHS family lactate transporter-like MFS transporter